MGQRKARARWGVFALTLFVTSLMVGGGVYTNLTARTANMPQGPPSGPISTESSAVVDRAAAPSPLATPSSTWLNVSGAPGPSPRYGASMAYDPKIDSVVLFGGSSLSYQSSSGGSYVFFNDTWTYRGGVWTNISSTVGTHPPAREFASFTYDAKDGLLILAGGYGYYLTYPGSCARLCGDMWSFNGTHWAPIPLPSAFPAPSSGGGYLMAAYDSTDGYVVTTDHVYYNNLRSTYSYVGGVWTNLSSIAPFTSGAALVDDPVNHGVLLFGGYTQRLLAQGGSSLDTENWFFRGGNWTNITQNLTVTPPPVQDYPAIAWDNDTQSVVLAAYNYTITPTSRFEGMSTWEFNGTWTNVSRGAQPTIAVAGTLAWDGADRSAVLFGGMTTPSSPFEYTNATWIYSSAPPIERLSVSASPDPADSGAPITLTASFLDGTPPFQYSWQFGDGGTSSNASPVHAYNAPGTYAITLNLTDGIGHLARASSDLLVVAAPSIHLSASSNPTDVGLSTSFQDGVTGGAGAGTIDWQFGDGGTAHGPSPTHTFTSAGNYTVRAWVNDSGGSHPSATFVEKVHSALAVSISPSPTSPALGELVNFSATATGGTAPYTYAWSFGDGGTGGNLRNISHIFTTNGPFEAQVVVGDAAGNSVYAIDNLSVALNISLLADWHVGASPLAMAFVSTVHGGVPGYSYHWSFGDGGTSEAPNPAYTYSVPGYYTAIVSVVDQEGQVAHADWSVLVVPGGGPLRVFVAVAPATVAVGAEASVTATIQGGSGGYALSWSAPGLSCGKPIVLTQQCSAPSVGTYSVELSITDASGATTSGTASLLVTNTPVGTKTPGGPSETNPLWGSQLLWAGAGAVIAIGLILGVQYLLGRPSTVAGARKDPRYAMFDSDRDGERSGGAPEPPEGPAAGAPRDPAPSGGIPSEDALEDLL